MQCGMTGPPECLLKESTPLWTFDLDQSATPVSQND
jgi:hypothetical protein